MALSGIGRDDLEIQGILNALEFDVSAREGRSRRLTLYYHQEKKVLLSQNHTSAITIERHRKNSYHLELELFNSASDMNKQPEEL